MRGQQNRPWTAVDLAAKAVGGVAAAGPMPLPKILKHPGAGPLVVSGHRGSRPSLPSSALFLRDGLASCQLAVALRASRVLNTTGCR